MDLEIFTLGRFEVRLGGVSIEHWHRAATKRLLKLLAVEPGHSLPAEQVASSFWPDDGSARVLQRLHHLVYLLRSVLDNHTHDPGRSFIDVRDKAIRLVVSNRVWIDVDEFERRLDSALASEVDPIELERALQLYQGPLLPEDSAEDWLRSPRVQLEQRFLSAMHALAASYRALGRQQQATATLERILKKVPADERAHRELIELYGRSGRLVQAERQYAECKAALARELGAAPSEQTREVYRDLVRRQPTSRARASSGAGAPGSDVTANAETDAVRFAPPVPLVELIGRDALLDQLCSLLRSSSARLVTLTGLGGVGKTQLAVHAASELAAEYRNGACFASLAEVSTDRLGERILRSLGLSEAPDSPAEEIITGFLCDKHLLLVLDNFEHVLESAALVPRLLERCPSLTVLVTSRIRLNLVTEKIVSVPTLDVAPVTAVSGPSRALSPAEVLFVERARAANPHFILDDRSTEDVSAIVRRLDGLPLAIELAAARSTVLDPTSLRGALDGGLKVVRGGGPDRHIRHRSLEQSFEWSYGLLSRHAQNLLQRASHFPAPFTVEAAAQLCAGTYDDVLDAIQDLADAGWIAVTRDPTAVAEPSRFRMHQTTRAFARQKLRDGADADAVIARFSSVLADHAIRLDADIRSTRAEAVVAAFEADYDNFLAALDTADETGNHFMVCRLVRGLGRFWGLYRGGRHTDRWVQRASDLADHASPEDRGRMFYAMAAYWGYRQNLLRARELAAVAVRIAADHLDDELYARASVALASAAICTGELEYGITVLEESLPAVKALGDAQLLCVAVSNLASAYLDLGRIVEARDTIRSCSLELDSVREQERARPTLLLACSVYDLGDHAQGIRLAIRALELERCGKPRPARLFTTLEHLTRMYCQLGEVSASIRAQRELREIATRSEINAWLKICDAFDGCIALLSGDSASASEILKKVLEGYPNTEDVAGELDLYIWLAWACISPDSADDSTACWALTRAIDTLKVAPLHAARICEAAAGYFCLISHPEWAARAQLVGATIRENSSFKRFPAEAPAVRRSQEVLDQSFGPDWADDVASAFPLATKMTDLTWLSDALMATSRRPLKAA